MRVVSVCGWLLMLCFALLQLGLHWRLSKQRCDSSSMMEYVRSFLWLVSFRAGTIYNFLILISTTKLSWSISIDCLPDGPLSGAAEHMSPFLWDALIWTHIQVIKETKKCANQIICGQKAWNIGLLSYYIGYFKMYYIAVHSHAAKNKVCQ